MAKFIIKIIIIIATGVMYFPLAHVFIHSTNGRTNLCTQLSDSFIIVTEYSRGL